MKYALNRDDKERIGNALMAYKREIRQGAAGFFDDYIEVEVGEVDELAARLGLDPEYYQRR